MPECPVCKYDSRGLISRLMKVTPEHHTEADNVDPGFFTPRLGQPSIPEATHGKVFDLCIWVNVEVELR